MNHARVAAMTAIALGLMLQAPLASAATAADDAAQKPSDAQSQADTPRMRHPPTAQMDAATPPDKSPADRAESMKHPPTAQMDRAAPDQRSPGATDQGQSPGANDEQSPGANDEQSPGASDAQPPGTTYDDHSQEAAPDKMRQQRDANGGIRV